MFFRSLLPAAAIALSALFAFHTAADAQTRVQRVNLLVMSDDADEETIPRNNRVFNRVINALGESMNARGFQVFTETGVTLGVTQQGRVRRTDAELLDIARSVPTPIDAVVVFQIYASIRNSATGVVRVPAIRLPGRIINVRTGQLLAAFEVGPNTQFSPLRQNCDDRECLLESVGDEARRLADDLALELAPRLEGFIGTPGAPVAVAPVVQGSGTLAPSAPIASSSMEGCEGLPTAFNVVIRGFSSEELNRIEEMMRAFRCIEHIRPLRVSQSQSDYWVEARSDNARLNRNLRQMIEFVGARGNVTFSGNRFEVIKTVTR
jgi:hypothetical protein